MVRVSGMTQGVSTARFVLVGLSFLLLGLVLMAAGGYASVEQDRQAATFQPTEATVVSSVVVDPEYTAPEAAPDLDQPDITYEYTVDGETYQSSSVFPGIDAMGVGTPPAEDVVASHPEGATVTAYYDPDDPSRAFLVKTTYPVGWSIPIAFGLLLTVIGAGYLVGQVYDFGPDDAIFGPVHVLSLGVGIVVGFSVFNRLFHGTIMAYPVLAVMGGGFTLLGAFGLLRR